MPNPKVELQRAHVALNAGDARGAARTCQKLLTHNPRDIDARYLHGRAIAALGRFDDAAAEFRRVVAVRRDHLAALVDLGIAETLAGRYLEARASLQQARALDESPAAVHFGLGLCHLGLGENELAAQSLERAASRNPNLPDTYNNLGVAYDRLARADEAIVCFRRAIDLYPAHAEAHRNLGLTLLARDDAEAAQRALSAALRLDPALPGTAAPCGEALQRIGRANDAEAAFNLALELSPADARAHLGLARLAELRNESNAAVEHYQRAAANSLQDPQYALVAAAALDRLGFAERALSMMQTLAAAHPADAHILEETGALLHRAARLPEALDYYERALDLDDRRASAHLKCGQALESMGAFSRAVASFETVAALDPDDASAPASIASCAFRLCDWPLRARMQATLRGMPRGIDALQGFLLLAEDLDPGAILESLVRRANQTEWPASPTTPLPRFEAGDRPLRVAYVSPDFRIHPVAYALVGMIEHHDRARISPIAVSLKARESSSLGTRVVGAFDEFMEVESLSDRDVVAALRSRGVDIAIDLAGLTTGARTDIFAMRAARTQINYLGFPGTMGMDFIDYLIADRWVVPAGEEPMYRETVLRMPGCYLPFDDTRGAHLPSMTRSAAGLPDTGFVFCAFNNGFKIGAEVFGAWMDLLDATPGSVLWLRSMGPTTAANLRAAAIARGIAAERLIFAAFEKDMDAHLARLALADLFLDTAPYNAHTTAAEALWCGVPVVTYSGRTFAGRVGTSLLANCGLEDLVCAGLTEYTSRALDIARSPALAASLRERTRAARGSATFDTSRYTRAFESLIATAAAARA